MENQESITAIYKPEDYNTCPYCNKLFISSIEHLKYCSKECFQKNRKEKRKHTKEKYLKRITCRYCGHIDTNYKNFYRSGCCMKEECVAKEKKRKQKIYAKSCYRKKNKERLYKKAYAKHNKEYNKNNRDKINKKRNFRNRFLKNKIKTIKSQKGCLICGEQRHYCLDFHHIDPSTKKAKICDLLCFSEKTVLEEIDKCTVLCRNCHKEQHNAEIKISKRKYRRMADDIREWINKYKADVKCEKCGYNKNIRALSFHHKNPFDKKFAICEAPKFCSTPEEVFEEIKKCSVLCENCHSEVHYLEKQK